MAIDERITIENIYKSNSFRNSTLEERQKILRNYKKERPDEDLLGHELLLEAFEVKRESNLINDQISSNFIDDVVTLTKKFKDPP